MKNDLRIAAVVVTYNRKELLKECLQALLTQTRPLDEIIVIDNASTDGTEQMIRSEFPHVTYVRLPENIGGAGGFHEGMKLAYEKGYDWIWVMDDDVIPSCSALQVLLDALNRLSGKVGLLCSHVTWTDGTPHIMNVPQISSLIRNSEGYTFPFNEHIEKGLIRISACSFVSVLVSRYAIEAVGLPIKEMFVYGDDLEFTQRVCLKFQGYYVFDSKVLHKTKYNRGVDLATAEPERLYYYYFLLRNSIYLARRCGLIFLIKYCLLDWPKELKKALKRRQKRMMAMIICFKALIMGLLFHPKIRRPSL